MPTPKETATRLAQNVRDLHQGHRKMVKMLLDAMAPDVRQRERDELRKVFADYLKETADEKKPDMERGGASLE